MNALSSKIKTILLNPIEKKFNAFSLREKALTLITVLLGIGCGWYTVLYGYLLVSHETLAKRALEVKSQLGSLEKQIDNFGKILGRDSTSDLLIQANILKKENEILRQKIQEITNQMLLTKEMTHILNELVSNHKKLTIINMESLETESLFLTKNSIIKDKTIPSQIYRHGLKIEMLGGYFEIIQFLKKFEQQNLNLIWDEIDYEVKEYPKAKVTIILHALNLDEGWIDV